MLHLKNGQLLTHEELRDAVRDAVNSDGRSQVTLADLLGVHQTAVSGAVNESGMRFFLVQVRLLEALTPFSVEKTLRVIRKPKR